MMLAGVSSQLSSYQRQGETDSKVPNGRAGSSSGVAHRVQGATETPFVGGTWAVLLGCGKVCHC